MVDFPKLNFQLGTMYTEKKILKAIIIPEKKYLIEAGLPLSAKIYVK
jgi:hypothetical protein